MADNKELIKEITKGIEKLSTFIPSSISSFNKLNLAGKKDGHLNAKTKELIALGIAISDRCEGCIAFHTKNLINLGVTIEEFSEALSVAIYMAGGPGVTYAAKAIQVFEELSKN